MSWINNDNASPLDPTDLGFDVTAVEPENRDFDVLKPGPYVAIVTGAEVKAPKSNPSGRMLSIECTIVDGPGKGRKAWENLTIVGTSEKATQIGRAQVAALFAAAGVRSSSVVDLLQAQTPIVIQVGVEPARDGYEARNRIRGFKSSTSNATAGAASLPSTMATKGASTPAAADNRPAFMRK